MDKEQRRKQALEWGRATGKGPGSIEYAEAFFAGYFDHAQTRSDGIESHVIGEFEALLEENDRFRNLLTRLVAAHEWLPGIRPIQDEAGILLGIKYSPVGCGWEKVDGRA
jgi:hypothetical protein